MNGLSLRMQHGNRAHNVEAAPLVNGQNSLRTGAAGYHAANVSVIGSHHGRMPPTRCRPVTCHATGECHPFSLRLTSTHTSTGREASPSSILSCRVTQ